MPAESINGLPWRIVLRGMSSAFFLIVGMLLFVPTPYLPMAAYLMFYIMVMILASPSRILCQIAPIILHIFIPPALLIISITLVVVHWPDTGSGGISLQESDHSGISGIGSRKTPGFWHLFKLGSSRTRE